MSCYARCVASCVTYDMNMTHPTIHVLGSQRGKNNCTDDFTRGRPAGLSHNSKGSTFDFLSHKNVFGRPVIREQDGKFFWSPLGECLHMVFSTSQICEDMKSSCSSSHELIDTGEASKLQDTWERSFLQMFFSDVSNSYTE